MNYFIYIVFWEITVLKANYKGSKHKRWQILMAFMLKFYQRLEWSFF